MTPSIFTILTPSPVGQLWLTVGGKLARNLSSGSRVHEPTVFMARFITPSAHGVCTQASSTGDADLPPAPLESYEWGGLVSHVERRASQL
ncbi:MAG: hypothetical protein SFV15_19120 [Polyangiaceae bacterium]|nr:hypothetical protein [Polyangiaceae bacterium]